MKNKLGFSALLVTVYVGTALLSGVQTSDVDCKYTNGDSRWRISCNWCRCTETGRGICTRRGCPEHLEKRLEEEKVCEGVPEWKIDDCNWCTCDDGRANCTSNSCGVTPEVPNLPTETKSSESECEFTSDESRWRDVCNWCRCTKTGRAMCTRRLCPPGLDFSVRDGNECEGNAKWKRDCNWCDCVNGRAICTSVHCTASPKKPVITVERIPLAKSIASEPICESSSTAEGSWKEQCNWCRCLNGRSMCTRKYCRPNFEEKSVGGHECSGEVRWKNDCNWCQCVDGVAVCSVKNCTRTEKHKEVCKSEAGEGRWREDCNWCSCGNGNGLCTKRGCLPGSRLSEDPSCEGEITWKHGECNWCRCVDEKAICTNNTCDSNNEERDICTSGQSWIEGCNTCFCNNGASFCTRRACIDESTNEIQPAVLSKKASELSAIVFEKRSTEADCTDGSKWRKECNWCRCSNGVGFCTQRGCIPEYKARIKAPYCEDNSQWREGCNICKCLNGVPLCTKKDCTADTGTQNIKPATNVAPNKHMVSVNSLKKVEKPMCDDGSRWTAFCNWCVCSNGIGLCEQKACLTEAAKNMDKSCDGKSRWKVGCNWCTCENGRGNCTNFECPSASAGHPQVSEDPPEEEEATCEDGSVWGSQCNWCRCMNGRGICTLRGCLPGHENALEGKCEGNSKWKKDCNWCHCVDGKAVCTQKACHSDISNDPESTEDGSSCISGNSWTEDCNMCVCNNGIPICTKKSCASLKSSTEECLDAESWKDDCNSCRCVKGQSACTRKICKAALTEEFQLPEICSLPPILADATLCGGFETKWTFNKESSTCDEVVYGGCGGTENLFSNKQDCLTTCGTQTYETKSAKIVGEEEPKERCYMPVVPGPCFASMIRFAFFPERNRCEKFFYGGCQGNQNNFASIEECHNICGGNPPILDPECDRSKCDWKRYAHYIAQSCEPVYDGGSCCPMSFDCKKERERVRDQSKCLYKGKEYQANEKVPVEDKCSSQCRCAIDRKGITTINCAAVDCPSVFNELEPGCRPLYEPDKCCATDKECTNPEVETRAVDCEWGNSSWKIGDKMIFNDFPCQSCVCTSEFTNPRGPGCTKVNCGFDYKYNGKYVYGCIPIFFEDRCCSIDWLCPHDKRLLEVGNQTSQNSGSEIGECSLGSLVVPVGSKVALSDCQIKCSCLTPPSLTCVKYRSCELAEENIHQPRDEGTICPDVDCPPECTSFVDHFTGCPKCLCTSAKFTCQDPVCPPACQNPSYEFDESVGCKVCNCECRKDPKGRPPCPMDCKVKIFFDKDTGCDKCVCDRSNPGNPFSIPGQ